MDLGRDISLGLGRDRHHRERGIHIDGFPDRALDLQPDRGLALVVTGDGHCLQHLATVIGAIKLDGYGAGLPWFHLASPFAGSGATTGRLHIREDKHLIANIRKHKRMFDEFAGLNFSEIIHRRLESNLRPDGSDCKRGRCSRS